MTLPTFDCFDCANAAAARDLTVTDGEGELAGAVNVVRDRASSGHAYKEELVEMFGSGYVVSDARMMRPRNPAAPVSPLFLANEIYTFTTGVARPPLLNWWPWERIRDYYASEAGYERPYGYGAFVDRPSRLEQVVELLRSHPTTKRAVVTFQARHYLEPSADTPCPIATQYRIVEGSLCTVTSYRSHDYFGGYRTDPLRVSFLQQFVAAALGTMDCDVTVGSLAQFDGSLHYYPRKRHGDLSAIARWDHADVPSANWAMFTADYVYYDEVLRDLESFLLAFQFGNTEVARTIQCPSLRSFTREVLAGVAAARSKYGYPPHIPSPTCCAIHAGGAVRVREAR
jgi:Thymidylate synthase